MINRVSNWRLLDISTKKYPQAHAKLELIDYHKISKVKWFKDSTGYARMSIRRNGIRTDYAMHRVVIKAKPGQIVDHINGDPLDNRRSNLRIVTASQNNMNSKPSLNRKYKGVYKTTKGTTYESRIGFKGKQIYLGCFKTQEEAAAAYDDGAMILFGDFARLNNIGNKSC